jgi:hypothetical protein
MLVRVLLRLLHSMGHALKFRDNFIYSKELKISCSMVQSKTIAISATSSQENIIEWEVWILSGASKKLANKPGMYKLW